ncbi:MAG: 2-C-methyl-D-erythritol 2,4-cyclodiphosphate synthase [Syntrophomonadaceae bacterium]|nr:2-C-methyl-D-erythritol 2,4-cyclodiphosphate synthase [Syntrophomonadaceae bacterium]
MRIGIGYDVHSLQTGRKLVLGGVHIPFDRGLLGHSDADVLLHAICDALLGAAALGDIGQHFPNTDPAYKNIESLLLLNQVNLRLVEAGYRVKNIDSTIIAQEPRLSPYLEAMKNNIASQLGISPNRVNVKATTSEKLGFEGRGEGISAQAIALIDEI